MCLIPIVVIKALYSADLKGGPLSEKISSGMPYSEKMELFNCMVLDAVIEGIFRTTTNLL